MIGMTAKLAERLNSNEFLQQIDTKGLKDKATDKTEHSVMRLALFFRYEDCHPRKPLSGDHISVG